jgi:hypothetical protein
LVDINGDIIFEAQSAQIRSQRDMYSSQGISQ